MIPIYIYMLAHMYQTSHLWAKSLVNLEKAWNKLKIVISV